MNGNGDDELIGSVVGSNVNGDDVEVKLSGGLEIVSADDVRMVSFDGSWTGYLVIWNGAGNQNCGLACSNAWFANHIG